MIVPSAICTSREPSKSIQVQLPLKRGKLRLAEVFGHDLVNKLARLMNHEAAPMRLPVSNKIRSTTVDMSIEMGQYKCAQAAATKSYHPTISV